MEHQLLVELLQRFSSNSGWCITCSSAAAAGGAAGGATSAAWSSGSIFSRCLICSSRSSRFSRIFSRQQVEHQAAGYPPEEHPQQHRPQVLLLAEQAAGAAGSSGIICRSVTCSSWSRQHQQPKWQQQVEHQHPELPEQPQQRIICRSIIRSASTISSSISSSAAAAAAGSIAFEIATLIRSSIGGGISRVLRSSKRRCIVSRSREQPLQPHLQGAASGASAAGTAAPAERTAAVGAPSGSVQPEQPGAAASGAGASPAAWWPLLRPHLQQQQAEHQQLVQPAAAAAAASGAGASPTAGSCRSSICRRWRSSNRSSRSAASARSVVAPQQLWSSKRSPPLQ